VLHLESFLCNNTFCYENPSRLEAKYCPSYVPPHNPNWGIHNHNAALIHQLFKIIASLNMPSYKAKSQITLHTHGLSMHSPKTLITKEVPIHILFDRRSPTRSPKPLHGFSIRVFAFFSPLLCHLYVEAFFHAEDPATAKVTVGFPAHFWSDRDRWSFVFFWGC